VKREFPYSRTHHAGDPLDMFLGQHDKLFSACDGSHACVPLIPGQVKSYMTIKKSEQNWHGSLPEPDNGGHGSEAGDEAVQVAKESRPDLIFSFFTLPSPVHTDTPASRGE